MSDLLLIETGSGGDVILSGNDIVQTDTFCNQVYIALFGGNPQETHTDREETVAGQQKKDWWGNKLLFPFDESKRFVSLTESTLYKITLNSKGRQELEQAVLFDLEYLKEFSNFSAQVSILGNDRLEIKVELLEPSNVENKTFVYLWDNAKKTGLICGCDVDYNLLLEKQQEFADFNNDFNNDFNS